ncbi:hypothetical protein SAMN06265360_12159 [Haloechinothrix alba]|uniref:Uncharacterized protein n=1 Tax=Haloechinothrix alba TaxID=664784 RepID=A0A238ZH98_9PSEU|nr:hypothetical protein [Haloechinothrix alba]SNR82529.1 hypothetical protein SAMN06265360_12159 [Haloechinothrix alba]
MSSPEVGEKRANERALSPERQRASQRLRMIAVPLVEAGVMATFSAKTVWSAARHPIGYWDRVHDQLFLTLKLCWFPLIVSTTHALSLSGPDRGPTVGLRILRHHDRERVCPDER